MQGVAEGLTQFGRSDELFQRVGQRGLVVQRGAETGFAVFHHFGNACRVVAGDGGAVQPGFQNIVAHARAMVARAVQGVHQDIGVGKIGVQIPHRAEEGNFVGNAQPSGLRF